MLEAGPQSLGQQLGKEIDRRVYAMVVLVGVGWRTDKAQSAAVRLTTWDLRECDRKEVIALVRGGKALPEVPSDLSGLLLHHINVAENRFHASTP